MDNTNQSVECRIATDMRKDAISTQNESATCTVASKQQRIVAMHHQTCSAVVFIVLLPRLTIEFILQ